MSGHGNQDSDYLLGRSGDRATKKNEPAVQHAGVWEDLRKLAELADEGYAGAHPRDSNNWKANEAFCRAATPARILVLIDAAVTATEALVELVDAQKAWNRAHHIRTIKAVEAAEERLNLAWLRARTFRNGYAILDGKDKP
jgi:hypothetical protein